MGPAGCGISSAESRGMFSIVSKQAGYKRYLRVDQHEIAYPDGSTNSFDIVGHKDYDLCFVCVFVWHSADATVTVLREFAQAALPHASTMLGLPCGGYEPGKHSSLQHAAECELSEEALLEGGSIHRLLPEDHPGILESKWCRNR